MSRIDSVFRYWMDIYRKRKASIAATRGHNIHFYNWGRVWNQDMWMVDFIERRGLLDCKPNLRIGFYTVFAPMWLSRIDRNDIRIFFDRENLHKPDYQKWLHRFLDDSHIDLSIGYDYLQHPHYQRMPLWMMWYIFPPTATREDIQRRIDEMEAPQNHTYSDRHFCAFLCSHDDKGRKKIFDQLSFIDKVHCDGWLFHNNNDLFEKYGNDKLAYLKHYRFNLTPENSDSEGYVTEKLLEAIQCGCIPIYSGSMNRPEPDILNQQAILFLRMGEDNGEVVDQVRRLNGSEREYLAFANQKRFLPGAADVIWEYYESLERKLREVIANV